MGLAKIFDLIQFWLDHITLFLVELSGLFITAQSPGLCTLTNFLALVGRHNGMYINKTTLTHSIPPNTFHGFSAM